jgi:hypothetical protein
VWHCKGACGEGGDVILWVIRAEGISFTHAVELLKRNYLPSAASAADRPPRISTVPKLPALFQANVDDQKLFCFDMVGRKHGRGMNLDGIKTPGLHLATFTSNDGTAQAYSFFLKGRFSGVGYSPNRLSI